ncbi:MAG: hypothetical protein J2P48_16490 [Alphaproteobacteria bacterium]|nr:hypothetical protein [Alphaproteobacteria bacterium]
MTEQPVGMVNLAAPDLLEERLGEADFVVLTTPETPDARWGCSNTGLFVRMKRGAYFIARGRCVVTADLGEALRSRHLTGAGLDVADPEPLLPPTTRSGAGACLTCLSRRMSRFMARLTARNGTRC